MAVNIISGLLHRRLFQRYCRGNEAPVFQLMSDTWAVAPVAKLSRKQVATTTTTMMNQRGLLDLPLDSFESRLRNCWR